MRMLIFSAGFGEGHNSAARALAAASEARFGPGSARVVDVLAASRPRLNACSRRAYLALINRAPRVWRSAYHWLDRSARPAGLLRLLRPEMRLLAEVIARERPDALCSTYPLYAFMIEHLRRLGVALPPHFNVVTDSISINSLWWRADCAGWFVPNEDSADVLRGAGVPRGKVHALGFPVAPTFARGPRDALSPLDGGERPRVLYIINSRTKAAIETAFRLLEQDDWDVTCTVGRNESLRTELMRRADLRPRSTPILGWTDEIPRLLATHHVVISKAGGATTQEAIAARCPMVVSQIVPGQEEGNCELLRRHGIGAYAPEPSAVMAELRHAFADGGRVWSRWRDAVSSLARPHAARDIVDAILPSVVPVPEAWRAEIGGG